MQIILLASLALLVPMAIMESVIFVPLEHILKYQLQKIVGSALQEVTVIMTDPLTASSAQPEQVHAAELNPALNA